MTKIVVLFILGFHLFLLLIFQFTSWPELISYPYFFSKGFVFYKDFVMPYTPGLPLILSGVISFFKFSPEALRIFTFIIILLTDLLLFFNLRLVNKTKVSLIFLAVYVVLQTLFDGDMLWFDYATIAFILAALFFSNKAIDKSRKRYIILSGLFFSLAVLIKQIAFIYFFAFLILVPIIFRKEILNKFIICLAAFLLPLIIFFIYLLITNSIFDFWNWNFYYPLFEWSKFPGYVALKISRNQVLTLILPLTPLLLIFSRIKIFLNKKIILAFSLLLAAILAIYPRFSYFHFQPALALVFVLGFMIFNFLSENFKYLQLLIFLVVVISEVYLLGPFNINSEIRFYAESEKNLVNLIKNRTDKTDKIYLFGPNSSIYALTNRLAPKPWIDTFGWYMEVPGIQDQLIGGFIKDPPIVIVYSPPLRGNAYDLGTYKPKKVLEYMYKNYYKDDVLDGVEFWRIKK
ncbi:glycosyltransferase family 39 protein [Candidatus Daviesbacteria bacterium]|nr:glycosyltransferase family 39 protein [Candidatus Daviesbacteria bacterium]